MEDLILSERSEILVPLMFMISIFVGWIGPNADFFAIQYKEIDWIHLITLFSIDSLSFVLNGIILWASLRINIMKSQKEMQMDFWLLMSVQEAAQFVLVQLC